MELVLELVPVDDQDLAGTTESLVLIGGVGNKARELGLIVIDWTGFEIVVDMADSYNQAKLIVSESVLGLSKRTILLISGLRPLIKLEIQ